MSATPQLTGKQFVRQVFLRVLLGIFLAVVLIYVIDAAVLRFRASTNRDAAFGTVTVRAYYAIPRKDKKTDLMFADPKDETCTNSLFPQMGYSPCWYLQRHKQQQMPD
jgi:hypothetical protein